ncbi:MAG: hypothetical protein AAF462_05210 [Thermodesulfobacteriota bacterium]
MSKKFNNKIKDIKLVVLSLMLLVSVVFGNLSYANDIESQNEINATTVDQSIMLEIELLPALGQEESESKVVLGTPVELYKGESIKKEDILRTIPSISTKDDKTLGLLIPPFAYFAQRF